MKKQTLYIIIAVLVAGLIALGIYHNWYRNKKELTLTELQKKHKDAYKALQITADKLAEDLENAKGESKVIIEYIPGETITRTVTQHLPSSCANCFSQIHGLDYKYNNEFFSLTDRIYYDILNNELKTEGAVVDVDEEALKRKIVEDGLRGIENEEKKPWRLRYLVQSDIGVQSDMSDPITNIGVGGGVEFLNVEKYLKADIGVMASAIVVPPNVTQSHVALGVDWRFIENMSVGLSYGRSISNDMFLVSVNFFPVN